MQSEVQIIVKAGAISPNYGTDLYIQAANGQDYFETGVAPPLAATYPNGSKVEFYNNTTASVEFTTYVVSTDDGTGRVYINPPFTTAPDENDGIDIFVYAFVGTNTFLDLYPNESISLSYQFTDLNNFTQIGTFSRDFRIPATKRNVEALGPLYDYNFVDDVLSFSRKYEAEIRVDTIPVSRGYLRIMAAYKQQDYLSDFQVAFYSQAPNFVNEIGDKKFVDIIDLPTLNADLNFNEVILITNKRIFALCDRAYNNKALGDFGEANTRPTQNNGDPLQPIELTPCLRADYLLTEIFKDAGFELDATNLVNIIQDYYVPWCNSSELKYTIDVSEYGTRIKTTSSGIGSGVFQFNLTDIGGNLYDLPNAWNNTTLKYLPPTVGYYTFQVQCTLWEGSFFIRKYDVFTNNYLETYILFTQPNIESSPENINFTSAPFYFDLDSYYEFWIGEIPGEGYAFSNDLVVTIKLTDLSGNELDYVKNAPDIKQIDFVSDIIKMHNLAVVPDLNIENKLKLEPMQTFIGSGAMLDWTKKLDTSKDIVIKGTDDLRKSKLTFTYSAGQDTYSKLFVDQGRIYGDYKPEPYTVNVNQIPSSFMTGETTVKLVAQSTPATQVDNTTLIAPRFWTQNGTEPPKFIAPQLRFLYYSETSPVYLYDDVNTFGPIYQNVPIVTHYSNTSGFNPDYNQTDLNWAPETPLHDYTANPFDNLFTLYWRDYLDTIYSDDARIMEANFALENTDIISLNFADYIFVKDAYWRVLELSDYKIGQKESTRVKLLKMNPGVSNTSQPRCDRVPIQVSPDGSVIWQDLNGNPIIGTSECCKQYNYTWSADTNTCFAKPSDRPSPPRPNNDTSGKGEISGLNTISAGLNNIYSTVNLDAGLSSFSVFAGKDIKNSGTNDNIIAVGDTIELKGDQRGAAMFGKSIESAVPGLVIGGGWTQDDRTYPYNGSQSAGTFLMSNQGIYPATLNNLELFIEGIANKRIEMEDEMLWYMRMHVMVQPTINQYINATITAQMGKTGGIAFATAPIVQYQDTSMVGRTVALVIDTATNTAQHRLNIQIAGGAYPFTTRLLAEINYTQFR
jgi:hypothetical protein